VEVNTRRSSSGRRAAQRPGEVAAVMTVVVRRKLAGPLSLPAAMNGEEEHDAALTSPSLASPPPPPLSLSLSRGDGNSGGEGRPT
jgi:hypothetical protein